MSKIMLVEDDNNLREIYQARLQAEGYDIVAAQDGEEALVLAKQEQPDLIISDVMMPKISGFEMLDILRNTEGLKHVRVIMLTALGQSDDKSRADKLGADRYLVKSQVTLEDIVNTAHTLLDGEQPAPAVAAVETSAPAPEAAPAVSEPAPVPAPTPEISVATPPVETPAQDSPAPASQPAAQPFAGPVEAAVANAAPVAPSLPQINIVDSAPTPATTEPLVTTPYTPAPQDTQAPVAPPAASIAVNDTGDILTGAAVTNPVATPEPSPVANPLPSEPAPAPTPEISVATPPVEAPAQDVANTFTQAPATSAAPSNLTGAESVAQEQAEVQAQIESFINTEQTPEAAVPTTPGQQPFTDQLMADAVDTLTASANASENTSAAPSVTVIEPSTAPASAPTAETGAPAVAAPDPLTASSTGGQRIIQPLSSSVTPKVDLQALMADEEAKEKAASTLLRQNAPAGGQTPAASNDPDHFDPNSIAL